MPSLSHWLTKTIATSEDAARVAAEVAFVPSLYCTFAPGALCLNRTSAEAKDPRSPATSKAGTGAFDQCRSADRVHLRRPAARKHADIRMRPDHCDGRQIRRIQRKQSRCS